MSITLQMIVSWISKYSSQTFHLESTVLSHFIPLLHCYHLTKLNLNNSSLKLHLPETPPSCNIFSLKTLSWIPAFSNPHLLKPHLTEIFRKRYALPKTCVERVRSGGLRGVPRVQTRHHGADKDTGREQNSADAGTAHQPVSMLSNSLTLFTVLF